ncbi:hypothetical protein C3747_39g369 [Trypanosoma cruzi]|uniref:Leucine-rich repeat protein (LRRP) n=2 Tax=Trypanosoma cruzi TaxID=5693 RepID=Q4D7C6_TRYCC|nr:hypothetical protein, conserved [Trypanosoma cruzi]EAN88429.1 hypothetical protein, conserved [Trypanosoma cruzi]PWV14033.1 hypothetical protein C3747_39g369 [Trypanosoma cruzi]RNC38495.1 hypothetical protein TcCL_NonESM12249 [Trypanosoma cruzi]|eukprot:XP_810280.1 hypothetical protein [Trypanosoma cruzi strain CL Brener]
MQKQQLTLDAAYKLTLWYSLFCEAQSRQERTTECRSHDTRVRHIAFSLLKASLPRKSLKSCCLSGACGRDSLTHKRVHFGRPEICPASGGRDDVCQCLAHATACVGCPVRLMVRDYSSSASLTGDRYGGLRCMLRHMTLQSVTFSGTSDPHDAQRVVEELSQTLMSHTGTLGRLSLGGIPAHVVISPLLRAMTMVDSLTELRLEDCGIQDVDDIVSYLNMAKHLRRISLRGNSGISEGMAKLGGAVATCRSLLSVDMGLCRLRDDHLYHFLNNLHGFLGRASFTFDVSNNFLSNLSFEHLRDAPAAFRATVSELDLSGHNLEKCGVVASAMLLRLTALRGILLDQCELGSRDLQRLCRVLSQKERRWNLLSFRGNALTTHDIKRLALVSLAAGSSLCVAGNSIGTGVQKLNLTIVLPFLCELDLSICDIRDEGLLQLANALEKVGPFSLRVLRLDGNDIGVEGKKGCSGLQFLGRALRASYAPRLEVLSLAHNRLLLRPLLTLVEQVSSTLRELHISYSAIANDYGEVMSLVKEIIQRQKGGLGFEQLDLWAMRAADADAFCSGELETWLEGQRAVRVITGTK